ncbi:MAG: zf-HC2 domain-containing protein, partial [Armatimonadetes bacterium]|nr:zf-HC2 domain-containing protein [Armatimonadota bacterium]
MKTCEQFMEMLPRLSSPLEHDLEEPIRAHIAGCEECRTAYHAARRTVQALRVPQAPRPGASEDAVLTRINAEMETLPDPTHAGRKENMMERILALKGRIAEKQGRRSTHRPSSWRWSAALAGAVALGSLAGMWVSGVKAPETGGLPSASALDSRESIIQPSAIHVSESGDVEAQWTLQGGRIWTRARAELLPPPEGKS